MAQIKAVIFDMDGMLIDTETFWQEEERAIFGELGIHITPAMQESTYGLGTYEVVKHWYNYQPWQEPDFQHVVDGIYHRVAKRIHMEAKAKEGVEYILSFFTKKGLPLALASSSPFHMIDIVLDKLNIRNAFQIIHSCEMEAYEKPHPAVYLTTAQRLGIEPVNCLVFEDSFVGLLAAKAARMKSVAIPERTFRHSPKYAIADLQLTSLNDFTEEHFQQLQKTL